MLITIEEMHEEVQLENLGMSHTYIKSAANRQSIKSE